MAASFQTFDLFLDYHLIGVWIVDESEQEVLKLCHWDEVSSILVELLPDFCELLKHRAARFDLEKVVLGQESIDNDGYEQVEEDLSDQYLIHDEEHSGHPWVPTPIADPSVKSDVFKGLLGVTLELY